MRKFTNVVLFSVSNCPDLGPVFCQGKVRYKWIFIRDLVCQNTVKPQNNRCEGIIYTYLLLQRSVIAKKSKSNKCQMMKKFCFNDSFYYS